MKRSNVNVIIDNAINSQDYYRMYSSRDFYRGTSFKMAGAWTPDTYYFNDEHIIDFISCEGALLYCLRGHLSSEWNKPNLIYKDDIIVGVESNPYWAFIMGNSGKSQKGDIGPIGLSGTDGITPQLKIEDGRWLLSMNKGQTWQDIGQATGDPGQNGTDGLNGENGSKGQIIYPEGIYNVNTVYQGTVDKTPYVYDSNDANYYVLNIVGTWQGTLHSNESPSTDTSSSWVKLEAFEALYTKVGIIGNGLIGSAVFNDVYMFSQQGVDENGDVSTHYENFNKDSIGTPIESTDPTKPGVRTFIPNMLFNFGTGAGYLAGGNISFETDGNIYAKNISVNGNMSSSDEEVLDLSYSSTTQTVTLTGLKNITVYMNESNITKSKVQLLNIDASVFDNMSSKSKYTIDIFNNGNIPLLFDSTGFYRPGFDMLESYSYVAVLPRQNITLKIWLLPHAVIPGKPATWYANYEILVNNPVVVTAGKEYKGWLFSSTKNVILQKVIEVI